MYMNFSFSDKIMSCSHSFVQNYQTFIVYISCKVKRHPTFLYELFSIGFIYKIHVYTISPGVFASRSRWPGRSQSSNEMTELPKYTTKSITRFFSFENKSF